ncbi:MAG: hypothetical protein OXG68_02345 [Chloroflexi bacterium]|nr:hypothetical protein [Chloroflexota bacterium]
MPKRARTRRRHRQPRVGDANDWAQVLADNFVPDNNPMLYFVGESFYIVTAAGLVLQDEWPHPLSNADKVELLALAMIESTPSIYHRVLTSDSWKPKLVEMLDTGAFVPLVLMYQGVSGIMLHNRRNTGSDHPGYHETLADYKEIKGIPSCREITEKAFASSCVHQRVRTLERHRHDLTDGKTEQLIGSRRIASAFSFSPRSVHERRVS